MGRARVAVCLTLLCLVPGAARAAELPRWTAHGPAGSLMKASGLSGFAPRLSYGVRHAAGRTQSWSLMATSLRSGRLMLQYHYQGFHAYFGVRVFVDVVVVHDGVVTRTRELSAGPSVCCTGPSEEFDYSGTIGLRLARGDRYGLRFGGSNADATDQLNGTMQIHQRAMFAGRFETRYGAMALRQSGNRVSGHYSYCNGTAKVRGIVIGRVLYGIWQEPCFRRSGRLRFVLSPSGESFTGVWNYFDRAPHASWDGRRV